MVSLELDGGVHANNFAAYTDIANVEYAELVALQNAVSTILFEDICWL